MKTFIHFSSTILLLCCSLITSAQSTPRSSSRSAAQYDAASIDENISYNKDMMYFSQMAIDRGSRSAMKDAASDMLVDFTGLLYSMEQLASAGGKKENSSNGTLQDAKSFNDRLAVSRGFSFDTSWIGGVLLMHQVKLIDLTEQKINATNERLKSAVSEAIPVLKRYITRLSTLQKQLIKTDQQEKKEAAKREKK